MNNTLKCNWSIARRDGAICSQNAVAVIRDHSGGDGTGYIKWPDFNVCVKHLGRFVLNSQLRSDTNYTNMAKTAIERI